MRAAQVIVPSVYKCLGIPSRGEDNANILSIGHVQLNIDQAGKQVGGVQEETSGNAVELGLETVVVPGQGAKEGIVDLLRDIRRTSPWLPVRRLGGTWDRAGSLVGTALIIVSIFTPLVES